MLSMAKVVGDLMQGYAIHIGGGVLAIVVGSEVYDFVTKAFEPVGRALGTH